jgi:hypothetical protein
MRQQGSTLVRAPGTVRGGLPANRMRGWSRAGRLHVLSCVYTLSCSTLPTASTTRARWCMRPGTRSVWFLSTHSVDFLKKCTRNSVAAGESEEGWALAF